MHKLVTIFIGIMIYSSTNAQESPESTPNPCPCCTSDHDAFDFWIGEWTVYSNGKIAGKNTITEDLSNCTLNEHWIGSSGVEGKSVNFFDLKDKSWHQLWIDAQGNVLRLKGNKINGSMVLMSQPTVNKEGKLVVHRIVWTPGEDGSVRQLWESSSDGGQQWATLFDGKYVKE